MLLLFFSGLLSYLVGMKRRTSGCFTCKRDNSHFLCYLKKKKTSMIPLGIFLVSSKIFSLSVPVATFYYYFFSWDLTFHVNCLLVANSSHEVSNLIFFQKEKKNNGKPPKKLLANSAAAECGIWSGSTLFTLSTGIPIKRSNDKN